MVASPVPDLAPGHATSQAGVGMGVSPKCERVTGGDKLTDKHGPPHDDAGCMEKDESRRPSGGKWHSGNEHAHG